MRTGAGQRTQDVKLLDATQARGGNDLAGYLVTPRHAAAHSPPPGRRQCGQPGKTGENLHPAVEASHLSVGEDIQSGRDLLLDSQRDAVVPEFLDVDIAELSGRYGLARVQPPTRPGVGAAK